MKMTMEIQTPLTTAKGSSSRAVITKDGEEYLWKTTAQTRTPWIPSNLTDPDSNILDFCFHPTPEIRDFIGAVEAEALAIVSRDSKTYLGVAGLSEDEVRFKFMSCLKSSARGAANFKTRGRFGHLRFWNADGEPLKDPTFANDARYQFVVRVSSLWVSEKGSFGLSFDLQHLQIYQERCPFKA